MIIVELKQGSPEWHDFRKAHIGASDISSITGNNPWKNAQVLWEEKTGQRELGKVTDAMIHGTETEPLARDAYSADTGILLSNPTCISDEWEIASASLDGITADLKKIVEFKCPTKETLYEKAMLGQIPKYYLDQIQWQLLVTKAERCDYVVYIDRFKYKTIEVLPDLKYQAKLLELAKEFWENVEFKTPPLLKDQATLVEEDLSNELALELKKWETIEEDAHQRTEYLKKQLKELHSADKKYIFTKAQVKMTWTDRKGSIDWTKYRLAYDISEQDLKDYRKESTRYCTFNMID